MAYFAQEFIERVRTANELTQVVASYNVQLKRAGSNMLGLCPFHNEKTPSFNVRPVEQYFRCFGCDAKGDVFRFVQLMEKVEFPEAVRMLAERAGLAMEFDNPGAAREAAKASKIKEALLWCCSRALDYFEENLAAPGGALAREYLASRGFSQETINTWRLGWAPDSWDGLIGFLLKNAKEPDQKDKVLSYAHQAGLVRVKEDEGRGRRRHYDLFRGRVMFPILDSQRRPIAFGGRVLQEKAEMGGKYINSPEGRLFEKRRVLFGLTQAAKEISLSGEAVVVEGYTDVIMCHQYGIRNVIATLGTSLTEQHVGQLRNHVRGKGRVIAFFDSDGAGQKATRRAVDLFMEQDVPLGIAPPLELKDAGDFLPRYGADEFKKKLVQAEDSFTYLLRQTIGQAKGKDPLVMGAEVRAAMETVNKCPDLIKRALMRARVAAQAGVPEETLPEPVEKSPAAPGRVAAERKARPPVKAGLSPSATAMDMQEALRLKAANWRRREAKLLRYMWENPEWCARVADEYPPDEWRDAAQAEVAALVRDEWDAGRSPAINTIRPRATTPEAADCLADLAFPDGEPMSEKDLVQTLAHVQDFNREEKELLLQNEIQKAEKAGDDDLALRIFANKVKMRRG